MYVEVTSERLRRNDKDRAVWYQHICEVHYYSPDNAVVLWNAWNKEYTQRMYQALRLRGYRITRLGRGNNGHYVSDAALKKTRKVEKPKPIFWYAKDGCTHPPEQREDTDDCYYVRIGRKELCDFRYELLIANTAGAGAELDSELTAVVAGQIQQIASSKWYYTPKHIIWPDPIWHSPAKVSPVVEEAENL